MPAGLSAPTIRELTSTNQYRVITLGWCTVSTLAYCLDEGSTTELPEAEGNDTVFVPKTHRSKCEHKRCRGYRGQSLQPSESGNFADGPADAVGRAGHGHERMQIKKNSKPAAVLIGPDDFELPEQ